MFELALYAHVLLWLIVLEVFLASGQASIYHPLTTYLGFHGLVFVLRPMLVHHLAFDGMWHYMRIQPSENQLILTLGVSSTALIAFSLASLLFGRTQTAFATAAPDPFSVNQKRALILTTLLLGPLVGYSIRSLVGGGLKGAHVGGTFILTGASGYTLEAQYMVGPLLCAWLAVTRFKWTALVPALGYVAYRSYTGWNRWTIVLLFLGIALVYAWQKRTRWLPFWSVAVAIPLFFLFLALGRNRDYFKEAIAGNVVESDEGSLSQAEDLRRKYDTQEFANFDFLCFVVSAVPLRTGTYSYGAQYLQLFTEPIPRKLWKEKPIGAPVQFFNLNAYGNFLGLTPSLAGDGWISGGWIGVIITLSIVGALLGLAHRWFWRNTRNNMASLFYLVGLAMLPQWFRDGGISISKFLFWNLSPLALWLVLTWVCNGCRIPRSFIVTPGASIRIVRPAETRLGRFPSERKAS
jgi:hypothetical protein